MSKMFETAQDPSKTFRKLHLEQYARDRTAYHPHTRFTFFLNGYPSKYLIIFEKAEHLNWPKLTDAFEPRNKLSIADPHWFCLQNHLGFS